VIYISRQRHADVHRGGPSDVDACGQRRGQKPWFSCGCHKSM